MPASGSSRMSEEQERRAPMPVVDMAALSGMASDAKNALAALRPGGKPPARLTAAGNETCEISVNLRVVTPILGGGPKLRDVDHVDIIRVPTVRGHLRFWWRALYGHEYDSPQKLQVAESALWGRPAVPDGGRSEVEVTIPLHSPHHDRDIDDSNPLNQVSAYALWPARVQGAQNNGHLPRRRPNTVTFTLRVVGPKSSERVLQNTIRAWILFGGYGSRTRRGLGSLTVDGDKKERSFWLPVVDADEDDAESIRSKIKSKFGFCPFSRLPVRPRQHDTTPLLAGASLFMHPEQIVVEAASAWQTALAWLNQFRQKRQPGAEPNRGSHTRTQWHSRVAAVGLRASYRW
jgi:CRISPR-associated protein Cmr1